MSCESDWPGVPSQFGWIFFLEEIGLIEFDWKREFECPNERVMFRLENGHRVEMITYHTSNYMTLNIFNALEKHGLGPSNDKLRKQFIAREIAKRITGKTHS